MELTNRLRKLAQQAMQSVDDVRTAVTYVQVTPGTYDPAIGDIATTEISHDVRALFTRLTETEMDWFPGDLKTQKAIVAYLDLPITPGRNDYFLVNGERWEIKNSKRVPTDAIWLFYVREP